jgi:hypothetical protein
VLYATLMSLWISSPRVSELGGWELEGSSRMGRSVDGPLAESDLTSFPVD